MFTFINVIKWVNCFIIGVISSIVIGPITVYPIPVITFLMCCNGLNMYFMSLLSEYFEHRLIYRGLVALHEIED